MASCVMSATFHVVFSMRSTRMYNVSRVLADNVTTTNGLHSYDHDFVL